MKQQFYSQITNIMKKRFCEIAGFDSDVFLSLDSKSTQPALFKTAYFVLLSVILVYLSTSLLIYRVTLSYVLALTVPFIFAGIGLFVAREVNIGRVIPPTIGHRMSDDEIAEDYGISWQRALLMLFWAGVFSLFLCLFIIEYFYQDQIQAWVADQYINYLDSPVFLSQHGFQREAHVLHANIIKLYDFAYTTHFAVASCVYILLLLLISSPSITQLVYPQFLVTYKRELHSRHRTMIDLAYKRLHNDLKTQFANLGYQYVFTTAYEDPPYNTVIKSIPSHAYKSHDELFEALEDHEKKVEQQRLEQQEQERLERERQEQEIKDQLKEHALQLAKDKALFEQYKSSLLSQGQSAKLYDSLGQIKDTYGVKALFDEHRLRASLEDLLPELEYRRSIIIIVELSSQGLIEEIHNFDSAGKVFDLVYLNRITQSVVKNTAYDPDLIYHWVSCIAMLFGHTPQ